MPPTEILALAGETEIDTKVAGFAAKLIAVHIRMWTDARAQTFRRVRAVIFISRLAIFRGIGDERRKELPDSAIEL